MSELQIKNKSGRIEISIAWDSKEPQTFVHALETFEKYRNKGWLPIGESVTGKWKHIFTFDPTIKRIIFMPLMEGG